MLKVFDVYVTVMRVRRTVKPMPNFTCIFVGIKCALNVATKQGVLRELSVLQRLL